MGLGAVDLAVAQQGADAASRDRFAELGEPVASAAQTAGVGAPSVTLVFTNRRIVEFRGTVLGRTPEVRAEAALQLLNRLAGETPGARVSTHAFPDGVVVALGDHPVFVVFRADVDRLRGESVSGEGAAAAARLQQAFDEAVELRTPKQLLSASVFAIGATLLYALLLWLVVRVDRRLAAAVARVAERRLRDLRVGEVMTEVRAPALLLRGCWVLGIAAGLVLTYAWATAVLRRFPYTRPWGESLRGALLRAAGTAGGAVVDQLPNLLTVIAIGVITRFLVRMVNGAFGVVQTGRLALPGVHPETAEPTRRIVVALLWLFALVLSYGYLPGSQSEAFKGLSVFVGLVISLGSSGIMNQVMSGLMLIYSRALRVGDFVRVGEYEGTVTQLGTLSTKVLTPRNEEITIPNALVVSHATTNFSRHAEERGVFAPTSVTIGYDAPWRQVEALLLLAAERTPGVRRQPKPMVMQTALCDFYVQYMLLVGLEDPARRVPTLNRLHAHIQDAFNEYGVQIMSPNYEADPAAPKTVPRSRWYAAPADNPPVDAQ